MVRNMSICDPKTVTSIILSGGGLRGMSYIGLIKGFEDFNVCCNITCFGGSSIGAVAAMLMCTGYRSGDLYTSVISGLRVRMLQNIQLIRSYDNWGIDDGEKVLKWLEGKVKHITRINNCTFQQLYRLTGNTLVVTATCLETQSVVLFSHMNYPEMVVSKALRMSISIPFVFSPVVMDGKTFVDGGLLANFPLQYFPVQHTIGIQMSGPIPSTDHISTIQSYIFRVWDCVHSEMTGLKELELHDYSILVVDTHNIGTFEFDLSASQRKKLYLYGYNTVRQWVLGRCNSDYPLSSDTGCSIDQVD